MLPLPAAVQPAYKGRTRRARSQVPVVEGKRHAVWCAQDIAGCSPCTNGTLSSSTCSLVGLLQAS